MRKSNEYLALEDAIARGVRAIRRAKGFRKTEIACELATLRKMQAALGEDRD
jgi:hypothetical protein